MLFLGCSGCFLWGVVAVFSGVCGWFVWVGCSVWVSESGVSIVRSIVQDDSEGFVTFMDGVPLGKGGIFSIRRKEAGVFRLLGWFALGFVWIQVLGYLYWVRAWSVCCLSRLRSLFLREKARLSGFFVGHVLYLPCSWGHSSHSIFFERRLFACSEGVWSVSWGNCGFCEVGESADFVGVTSLPQKAQDLGEKAFPLVLL